MRENRAARPEFFAGCRHRQTPRIPKALAGPIVACTRQNPGFEGTGRLLSRWAAGSHAPEELCVHVRGVLGRSGKPFGIDGERKIRNPHGFGAMTAMNTPSGDLVTEDLLLERQLFFALSVASRTAVSACKPVLQEFNLTHPRLVMLTLWEASPASVNEISEALLLGPATVSPLLKRLEASGYVTRRRVQGDECSFAVSLTPEGAKLRDRARDVPGTMLGKLGLSRTEAEELLPGSTARLLKVSRGERLGGGGGRQMGSGGSGAIDPQYEWPVIRPVGDGAARPVPNPPLGSDYGRTDRSLTTLSCNSGFRAGALEGKSKKYQFAGGGRQKGTCGIGR
jgi:DNA-binding MarR family transcriptional regulator